MQVICFKTSILSYSVKVKALSKGIYNYILP